MAKARGEIIELTTTEDGGSVTYTRVVSRVGNSRGITIPSQVLRSLGIDVGSTVLVTIVSPAGD